MPSQIDPSKPVDATPAGKADLRANLAFARSELEHMGYYDPTEAVTGTAKVDELLELLGQLEAVLSEHAQRLAFLEQA